MNECKTCGKATRRKHYCSMLCRKRSTIFVVKECGYKPCGKKFKRYASTVENNLLRGTRAGVFCSKECYHQNNEEARKQMQAGLPKPV